MSREQNREVVRELQGIAPLLRLLSPASQTPPYIQELALKALRNICLDNGACAILCVSCVS